MSPRLNDAPEAVPPRRRRPLRRFCVHCGRTGIGVVNVGLLLLALVAATLLAFSAKGVAIPVPAAVLHRLAAQLEREGLRADWSQAGFDLHGRIVVQDLEVHTLVGDPVLEAGLVLLKLDRHALLDGHVTPQAASADDATFFLPGYLAPEGVDVALVSDIRADVRFVPHGLDVCHAQGVVGDVRLHASGIITLGGADAPQPLALMLRDAALRLQDIRQAAASLGGASLAADIDAREAALLVEHVSHAGAEAYGVSVAARISADGQVSAEIDADRVSGKGVTAHRATLLLQCADVDALLASRDPGLVDWAARAAAVDVPGGRLTGVTAGSALPLRPLLTEGTTVDFALDGRPVSIDWRPDGAGGHHLAATGSATLQELVSLIPMDDAARAGLRERLQVFQPIRFRVTAHIPTDINEWTAEGDIDMWDLDIRGTPLQHAYVAAVADRHRVDAWRVWLGNGPTTGDCAWLQDLETLAWRLQVRGRAYPPEVGPALGHWWQVIWPSFEFDSDPLPVDVEVRGNWNDRGWAHSYSTVKNGQFRYNGVRVDSANVIVTTGRHWLEIYNIDVQAEQGTLRGTLMWLLPRGEPNSMGLDVRLDMPIHLINQAFDAHLEEMAEAWTFEAPPVLHLRGNLFQTDDAHWETWIAADAVAGPGQWRGIAFDSLDVSALNSPQSTLVRPLRAAICGGELTGWLEFPHPDGAAAAFQCGLVLEHAQLVSTVTALKTIGSGKPPETPLGEREGRINLDFTGGAQLASLLDTLSGTGNVLIYEADLGKVGVFGALSDVLSSVGIGLGTFSFDQLSSVVRIDNGLAILEDLEVYGPSANIDARGVVSLADERLEFEARVFLMRGDEASLLDVMGLILSPFGYVLELRLRGTLDEPTWRFKLDPRNLFDTPGDGLPTPWQDTTAPQQNTGPRRR